MVFFIFFLHRCTVFSFKFENYEAPETSDFSKSWCYLLVNFAGLIIYNLDGQPKEYKKVDPPLKYQHRCIAIFRDKKNPPQPTGIQDF